MIDPVQAFNMATSSILVPTTSSSVAPIPTVAPTQPVYEVVEKSGKITLWVVFFIMFLSTLAFIGMSWRVPVKKRLFHILTTFITAFATLSYFAMATGDGSNFSHIVVHTKNKHVPDTFEHIFRQIFWARYVDWSITTPLLLLDLAFLAGLDGASILIAIVADVIMVLTGLFAAYGVTELQKWGWYTMGCVAYLVVVYQLAVGGTRTVKKLGTSSRSAQFYSAIGTFTFVLWTLYPIVWGLGDGSRMLTVDGEILAYGVLDVLAKPVFGFWLLITHANSDASSIGGFWSEGLSREGALRVGEDEEN